MNKETLIKTISLLTASPKGILAVDESLDTCRGRFEKLDVPFTEEKRREYREVLVTTPGIEEYINAFILVHETFFHKTKEGIIFTDILKNKGIDFGVTAYTSSAIDFPLHPGEKISEGLDGLPSRLKQYKEKGASFSKWRAQIVIGEGIPTEACLRANAAALGRYALACQEQDIVPIVEPEILINGSHSIEKCYEVTSHNLDVLFAELKMLDVFIPGIILKTSMVISGKDSLNRAPTEKVAEMTIKCLKEHVPKDVGGVVFLSGGQEDEEAVTNLNTISKIKSLPWHLTFSYGRAIQNPALKSWAKNPNDIPGAQALLLTAAKNNSLASIGQYKQK